VTAVGPAIRSQYRESTTSDEVRRKVLERRLEEGYARIDQALQHGDDVERWESFWITLLREYEALCDGYAEAA
jgi:hypothetical protein